MKKFSAGIILFLVCSGFLLGNANLVLAQDPVNVTTNYDYKIGSCGINGDGDSFVSCLLWGFYYLVLYPSGMFATVTGSLFDVFVSYSISSASYTNATGQFINQGWGVIRDIANVMFIFILLYIAIRHILQMGSSNTKRLLTSLIIAALLINFSLFFSKVIIDAGNILARQFYSHIQVSNDDHPNGENVKTISQQLIGKINPQNLLASDLFTQQQAQGQSPGKLNSGYAFFLMALVAFVNITVGIVFLSVFLLFVARVVGLWFMMIFSPIAFASLALPGGGSFFGQFGWNGWRDNILKLSFMAPIFLFFLFLLVMFLQIIMSGGTPTGSATQKMMGVLIPFIVIIVVLKQAKKIATDMSGEFGSALTSAVGKLTSGALAVTGVGAGLALSGVAMAGRKVVGGRASRELNSGVHQKNVGQHTKLAKAATLAGDDKLAEYHRRKAKESANKVARLDKLSKGSFDVRRSEFLQKKVLGSGLGKLAGQGIQGAAGAAFGGQKLQLDLGKGKDTSYKKQKDEKDKKDLETAKLYDVGSQSQSRVSTISQAAGRGIDGQEDTLNHIEAYIKETQDDKLMTDEEKTSRISEAEQWREDVVNAKTDDDMKKVINGGEVVTKDNTKVIEDLNDNISNWQNHIDSLGDPKDLTGSDKQQYDDLTNEIKSAKNTLQNTKQFETEKYSGTNDVSKRYAGENRNGYADVVEATRGNSLWKKLNENYSPRTMPGEASVIADQIRRGPKDDNKEMIKKVAKNMGMNIDDSPDGGDNGDSSSKKSTKDENKDNTKSKDEEKK